MRLRIAGRGKLDNLSYEPLDRAAPAAGQLEIRVAVTGLNFRDVMNAMGMYPDAEKLNMPFGGECAGYVSAVGPGVTEFAVGDAVFGIGEGSFATYAISDVNYVVKKPPGISFEEATTIPATFLTAWYGLVNLAGVSRGKRVLVHAASGGVGLAAVQVCKGFGCEVFGTAKPGEKQDYLRANGVAHVMSSRDTAYGAAIGAATGGAGVDVVLNSLSGEGMIEASLGALSAGGHFVEIGKAGIWSAEQVAAVRPDVHYRATGGQNGMGKTRHGNRGEDRRVRVPPGTVVRDDESGAKVGELLELDMGLFGRRKTQGRVFGAEKKTCGNGHTQFPGFQ